MFILSLITSCLLTKEVYIRGNSMLPQYRPDQKIELEVGYYHCNKKKPNKKEVIVFKFLDKEYVKRVVAVAGNELSFKEHILYVNNINTNVILNKKEQQILSLYKKVPENSVIVLGDNLKQSKDSRTFGPIPISSIIGKVK